MGRARYIITLLLLFLIFVAYPQQTDSLIRVESKYTMALGTGWSHYINSLEIPISGIKKDFIGMSLRFMWEPEHRLSLGFESGFYRIFKVSKNITPEINAESELYVIPLLFVARMRVVDHLYLSAAPGLAVMLSHMKGKNDDVRVTQFSLANFEATASYLYPLNGWISLGGELRFLNIGKTDDYLYSVHAVCVVKL